MLEDISENHDLMNEALKIVLADSIKMSWLDEHGQNKPVDYQIFIKPKKKWNLGDLVTFCDLVIFKFLLNFHLAAAFL